MIRLWLFLLFSSFVTALSAAPATVRSGDHPDFVRFVIDIPVGADWNVGRVADGYAVRIDGVSEYNTSGVFSRISISRITNLEVRSAPPQLILFSDCACHATAFLWKSDKLVVDINDGVAPSEAQFEAMLDEGWNTSILPVLTAQVPVMDQPSVKLMSEFDPVVSTQDQDQLGALEQVVIEGLARAATQGLLAPTLDLELRPSASLHLDAHIARNEPGLLTHTSIDLGDKVLTSQPETKNFCLPEDYFAVGDWASELSFVERIMDGRSQIVGEFDKIDPGAVIELARSYLVFGFGREAQNTLNIDGQKSREREILFLLGSIIDGDTVEPGALETQLGCRGPAALWAFLAQANPEKRVIDRNDILRTFRSLPSHLRELLGPILSSRFRSIDDYNAAEMVLLAGPDVLDAPIEMAIAQTELLIDLGKPVEATEILAVLAGSNSRMTSKALIDYLTLSVASELDIDLEAVALGDILRYENKGDVIVGDLAEAQVTALVALDDLGAAFRLLAEEAGSLGSIRKDRLTSIAVTSATRTFGDTAFLELAFSMPLQTVTPEAQNVVAGRLLLLNLPERAAQLIGAPAMGAVMMERRYLRAQAAVEVGNGAEAIVELGGISTSRAEKLRKRAELIVEGREEISGVAFGDDWRLGNWASLAQGDDSLLRDVSRSVLSDVQVLQETTEPLADGRRLLARSSEMRNLLDELLTRYEPIVE